MLHYISILAILILLSVIAFIIFTGLFYAFVKLPRPFAWLMVIVLVGTPITVYKIYEKKSMLLFVPDALDVKTVKYSKEETWGFGPGGNEAGIRVYLLPEHTANKIIEKGINYFDDMPANTEDRKNKWWAKYWWGIYGDWNETPIVPIRGWTKNQNYGLDVYDYICKYGFCIDIKDEIVKEANSIVNSTGSYYAYSRVGMMVISPNRKVVLYFYNG